MAPPGTPQIHSEAALAMSAGVQMIDGMNNEQLSPLTEGQLETVRLIQRETGVLTVRDKDTYAKSNAKPYGKMWNAIAPRFTGGMREDPTTRKMRVIEMWYQGSPRFPEGVPIGVTRVYRVKHADGMGPEKHFLFVGAKYDAVMDARKAVRAFANGKRWMTQGQRRDDELAKADLRLRAQTQHLTPVESTAEALAAAMVKAAEITAAATKAAEPKPARHKPGPKPGTKYKARKAANERTNTDALKRREGAAKLPDPAEDEE